jgi:hypothetical protein
VSLSASPNSTPSSISAGTILPWSHAVSPNSGAVGVTRATSATGCDEEKGSREVGGIVALERLLHDERVPGPEADRLAAAARSRCRAFRALPRLRSGRRRSRPSGSAWSTAPPGECLGSAVDGKQLLAGVPVPIPKDQSPWYSRSRSTISTSCRPVTSTSRSSPKVEPTSSNRDPSARGPSWCRASTSRSR